jgi:anti-anti-sigma factor
MPSASEALVCPLDHLRPGARLVRPARGFDDRAGAEFLTLVNVQCALSMDLLILDLTELTAFGSEALRIVVRLAMDLGRVDIGLCLVATGDLVATALDDAGVLDLFELHDSVDEALTVL